MVLSLGIKLRVKESNEIGVRYTNIHMRDYGDLSERKKC